MSSNPSLSKIHFISIGGSVMHNLAIELHLKGYIVTGSDDEIYEPSASRLAKYDLLPAVTGWFPEKITSDLESVILGMHARQDNPELAKAKELGIKVYSYPEYIFEQSQSKQRVVIAGSHGKTTTTSMILHVLKYHNRVFNYLVGAQIEGFDNMVKLSENAPVIIIEGDEYFTSPLDHTPKFMHYQPHIALISGIAWDHFNVFPTWESYVKQFELLADSLPKAGAIIFDETDDMLDVIGQKDRPDVVSIPYNVHPNKIENGKTILLTAEQGEVPVMVFGNHNMKNISGAHAVCERLGITDEEFYKAIQTFKGASKRLELLGSSDSVSIYRDFAHAPSKVEATTAALKQQYPDRKLVACAELHTFSSLNKLFLKQYRRKLTAADVAIVYYNPLTIEHKKLEPISEEDIKNAFKRDDLHIFTSSEDLNAFLRSLTWKASNLLLMSSGTFGDLDMKSLAADILENQ
ncbi:UDP-N-acetylmuramate--L-alanyl-gamma-D-glutamyl-meso-2,6-diaminoheptandioate ligase [Dyadobacter sp. CECT 9623]|uniref:UDP-N-acetylmuramate--L-alanyl-gamma-D-glutamyl-meso-2,6-diaminoheptandioate ligase n=1 Tax=Dyadobacter linearis TaxID=2823330 RepID=A0ABN7RBI5_9BACT|nr:Mur ligase family protein [Dyadobacter sp. CECT 9623]CAG5071637.1 UDP-N-acetylmuramate--L-alanyl-gamma-D-glutamyl-meso-2,6-diaminoheptandioate ligase [Dyadobacter sp. CECT 9623]